MQSFPRKDGTYMKRIVSLILTLCMILGCGVLSACSNQSAYDVVNSAMEKTSALDSMDATVKMTMDIKVGDETINMPINYKIKAAGLQGENPKLRMEMTTTASIAGSTNNITMDIYTADGWTYIASNGSGYKMKQDAMDGQMGADMSTDLIMQPLPEALLKDCKLKKNNDGSESVRITIAGNVFTALFKDMIDSMNSYIGTEAVNLTISDSAVTVTVKDGYISVYALEFSMNMEVSGTAANATVSASAQYNNPGKAVTVTPPEGYENFPEIG